VGQHARRRMLAERLAIDEEGLAEVLLGDLNQSG
jgi:hypothetical protein